MARPHYSSRLEDWFNVGVQAVLRRRGWQERIIPQVGYGNTAQAGLLNVSALNGSFDNILSLGSGNIL